MTLRAGDVVLIRIDFHSGAGGKLRPTVVLLDSGDEIVRRLGELARVNRTALKEGVNAILDLFKQNRHV
jgi:hypothetical protein